MKFKEIVSDNEPWVIVYHRSDFDGLFSAAAAVKGLVQCNVREVTLIPFEYRDQLELSDDTNVIVVDCLPQECYDWKRFNKFVWVDHHISSLRNLGEDNIPTFTYFKDGTAASILCYSLFVDEADFNESPQSLCRDASFNLVGQWDVFDLNPSAIHFHYGFERYLGEVEFEFDGTSRKNETVMKIFNLWFNEEPPLGDILMIGKEYLVKEIESKSRIFERLVHKVGEKLYTINSTQRGSFMLSEWLWRDREENGVFVCWNQNADGGISFSIYGPRMDLIKSDGEKRLWKNVDFSKIATWYNGGGHRLACGGICNSFDEYKKLIRQIHSEIMVNVIDPLALAN
jgi:oligoribonuclease NrnB/cAMP/cGMP phosphodiesterase (DHH superfamily)